MRFWGRKWIRFFIVWYWEKFIDWLFVPIEDKCDKCPYRPDSFSDKTGRSERQD